MKEDYKTSCEMIVDQGNCHDVPCSACPFSSGELSCNQRGFCGVIDVAVYDEKLVKFAKLWLELNND